MSRHRVPSPVCWSVLVATALSSFSFLVMMASPSAAQEVIVEPLPAAAKPSAPPEANANPTDRKLPDPQNIQILELGMKYIVWNESTRGPLLAIGADTVGPWRPRPEDMEDPDNPAPQPWYPPPPLTPAEYRDGWRVDTIAGYFGRKLTRCGSLSVLSPRLMTVFNDHLPENIDPMEKIHSYERAQMLQASLTEDQWRKIGSAQGLGIEDLDESQRKLFLALIPEKARLSRTVQRAQWGESIELSKVPGLDPANQDGKLTTAQRMGARLRMNRTVRMWLPDAENGNAYGAWVPDRPENVEYWTISDPGEWSPRREVYGVKLADDVPAKLKQSQLDYQAAALDGEVVLGASKTVGDLIKEISKLSGLELYADGRLAGLKVTVRQEEGTTVRAGDVLKAVALAVTGTYRQVGPAYVLTDDIEGIGTRRARIQEWQEQGNRLRNSIWRDFYKRMQKMHPASYIQFAPDDPLALSDKLNAKLEERRKVSRSRWSPPIFSASDLTPAQRQQIEMALRAHDEQARYNPQQRPVSGDAVNLQLETRMTLMVPGLGPVDLQNGGMGIDSLSGPPEKYTTADGRSADRPFTLPPHMSIGGILLFSPTSESDIDAMLNVALQRGLKQLWVQLPVPEDRGKALLTAAVAKGKERGLPVYGVIRLMQAPPVRGPKDDKTFVNILGETGGEWAARIMKETPEWDGEFDSLKEQGDWINPSDPATLPLLQKRILDIAQIPGLAGVVLRDTAVPGYQRSGKGANPYDWIRYPLGEMGYTLDNRLAFLREAGYDPIDIVASNTYFEGGNLTLPFFPDQQINWVQKPNGEYGPDEKVVTPQKKWSGFRFKATQKLMGDLYKAVNEAKPNLNILMASFGDGWNDNWFVSWDKANVLPDSSMTPGQDATKGASVAQTLLMRIDCSSIIRGFEYQQEETPQQILFNRSLNQMMDWQKEQAWNGFVLDFAYLPVKAAVPLIMSGINPPGSDLAAR